MPEPRITQRGNVRENLIQRASRWATQLRNNRPRLSFGIQRRMLLFIVVLVCLAYGIGEAQKARILQYVIDREKVDLKDESQNLRLSIELSLQTAYAKIVSHDYVVSDAVEGGDAAKLVRLAGGDAAEAGDARVRTVVYEIAKAWLTELPADAAISHRTLLRHFDRAVLEGLQDGQLNEVAWSELYWADSAGGTSPSEAFIEFLLPPKDTGKQTAFQHIRLDITGLALDLVEGARQVNYFVGYEGDVPRVWIAPNGRPQPRAPELPPSLDTALNQFQELFKNVSTAADQDLLYCPDRTRGLETLWKWTGLSSDEGVEIAQLFDPGDPTRPLALQYSVSMAIPKSIFKNLSSGTPKEVSLKLQQELDNIARLLRQQDSYARIEMIEPNEGWLQVRTRAANAAYLDLANLFIEAFVKKHSPEESVVWNRPVIMDDFALSIQRVKLPSSNVQGTRTASLGYMIRSASLAEIKAAVTDDLNWLGWLTGGAIVFAIAAALVVSRRLINPLTRMTVVAGQVSQLGRQKSARTDEDLERLLAQLPTEQSTELGLLAQQFEKMTRDLMRAKRQAEQTTASLVAEQRKGEQVGREKAIATEVSEHLVRLLGSVSHDMRQPLVQISTHTERLVRQADIGEQHKNRLKIILRNVHDLDGLIEDILDYNRIIKGEIYLKNETFDLGELLDEIGAHYRDVADRKGIALQISKWWNGSLHTDRLRLKRVLNNLLSNAIHATHEGMVRLQIGPLGTEQIEISVTDTGVGMNEVQQMLVFKFAEDRARIVRQNRSLTCSKDSNSTGLGLHIAKQLVEKMGGTISFTSAEGKGTTFVVRLPQQAPAPTSEPALTSEPVLTASLPPVLSVRNARDGSGASSVKRPMITTPKAAVEPKAVKRRAVIVDDDPRCTEILATMLGEMGYETEQVNESDNAIEIIKESMPDLVTLDVLMPDTDGWQILEKLKASRLTDTIPVIMVTVHPDQSKATLLGANGFVSKPIQEAALTQSVLQAIGDRRDARVLLVDDEPQCLIELEELLQPLSCRVVKAQDGVAAMERIAEESLADPQQTPFDLAIIDLYMPRMDGFELVHKLGEMPHTRDMPIIVLSAGVLTADERSELLPHVTRFFSKGGVDLRVLQGEIVRLLREPDSGLLALPDTPVASGF